jgi:hypothetical protein
MMFGRILFLPGVFPDSTLFSTEGQRTGLRFLDAGRNNPYKTAKNVVF